MYTTSYTLHASMLIQKRNGYNLLLTKYMALLCTCMYFIPYSLSIWSGSVIMQWMKARHEYHVNRIHVVIYLPYTFPYIFEYWLIPNCTRIIAWDVVHNCTLFLSMARRLIHNGRFVGKVFQSWQCPLLSVLPIKRKLTPLLRTFLPSFSSMSLLEHKRATGR